MTYQDHLPNLLIINKFQRFLKTYIFFGGKFNEVNFLSNIQSVKWDEELEGHCDMNTLFETFSLNYQKLWTNMSRLKRLAEN